MACQLFYKPSYKQLRYAIRFPTSLRILILIYMPPETLVQRGVLMCMGRGFVVEHKSLGLNSQLVLGPPRVGEQQCRYLDFVSLLCDLSSRTLADKGFQKGGSGMGTSFFSLTL